MTLARVGKIEVGESIPQGSAQFVLNEATAALPLGDVIDFAKERQRLEKEATTITAELDKIGRKLGNQQFLAKAKPEVVEEQRERLTEHEAALARVRAALARLGRV